MLRQGLQIKYFPLLFFNAVLVIPVYGVGKKYQNYKGQHGTNKHSNTIGGIGCFF